MSLPPSFTTQSLDELKLLENSEGYRPTNRNQYRFLFEPGNNSDPASWITIIDQRAPQLNSQWPAILASAPDKLKTALSEIGQTALSEEAGLAHMTMNGAGEAMLLVALSDHEDAHSLQVSLDDQGLVTTIKLTR